MKNKHILLTQSGCVSFLLLHIIFYQFPWTYYFIGVHKSRFTAVSKQNSLFMYYSNRNLHVFFHSNLHFCDFHFIIQPIPENTMLLK